VSAIPTTTRADRRPVFALALALLSIPGSTVAWDLPLGGLWIGLPLATAAILIARPVRRTTSAKIAMLIAGLAIAQMAAYSAISIASADPSHGERDHVAASRASVASITRAQPKLGTAAANPLSGSLVYSKELPAGFQLFTSRADGTGERQITDLPGAAEQPDWSPDGRTIVFQYDKPRERGCSIAFVDADGGNFRTLGGGPRICDNQPAYRPDGKRIVFVHYDDRKNTETLTVSKLDGSDRRELPTRLVLGSADPNYSPDGKLITFVHLKEEEKLQALFSIRAGGTVVKRLTPYRWEVAVKHDWSPDGRHIAITRQRHASGKAPIALLLRRDGKLVRTLARSAYVGAYAPDGRNIVLRRERNDGAEGRIAVVRPSGRGLRALTPWTELRPRFIDWGSR